MEAKKVRQLKACGQSGYRYKPTPVITLKGEWLREAGFDIVTLISVSCEDGKLIITSRKAIECPQANFVDAFEHYQIHKFIKGMAGVLTEERILEVMVDPRKLPNRKKNISLKILDAWME